MFYAQAKEAHKILCSRYWSSKDFILKKMIYSKYFFSWSTHWAKKKITLERVLRQQFSVFPLLFLCSSSPSYQRCFDPQFLYQPPCDGTKKKDKGMKLNIWHLDDCLKIIWEVQNQFEIILATL